MGHLIVQRGNNVREPFDPRSRLLARRQEHFHAIQMAKQTLGERAVETLRNSLVSVNFSTPATNVYFVVVHFFGQTLHKLTARVNLQNLRRSQRAAFVNRPSQLWQSLSRSEARLLCNSCRRRQRPSRICKLFGCGAASRVAEKEGALDGTR